MTDGLIGPEPSEGEIDFFAHRVSETLSQIESGEIPIDFDTLHERAKSVGLDVARSVTIDDRSDICNRDEILKFDTPVGDERILGFAVHGYLLTDSRDGETRAINLVFSFNDVRNGTNLSFNNKGVAVKGSSFGTVTYPNPSGIYTEGAESAIAETMLAAGNVFNQLFGDGTDV